MISFYFTVIQGFLESVHAFQKEQTSRRAKMVEDFQNATGALASKLNEIIQLQHRNVSTSTQTFQ